MIRKFEDGFGRFIVTLRSDRGKIRVARDADPSSRWHFRSDEKPEALLSLASLNGKMDKAFFLIKDASLVNAFYSSERYAMIMSTCHKGNRMLPCLSGDCKECRAAMKDAMAHAVIGGVELPDTDLMKRLRSAVYSTIGCVRIVNNDMLAITDEQLEKANEEIGETK